MMIQILCLLASAQALKIKRNVTPSVGQQLIDIANGVTNDVAKSIFQRENASVINTVAVPVKFNGPVPKDNDIELFYRIKVFDEAIDGYIEYRADGVYYNLHLKDGCLNQGETLSAKYVIWVSSGNRRNDDFFTTTIVDQNMYWYHEG